MNYVTFFKYFVAGIAFVETITRAIENLIDDGIKAAKLCDKGKKKENNSTSSKGEGNVKSKNLLNDITLFAKSDHDLEGEREGDQHDDLEGERKGDQKDDQKGKREDYQKEGQKNKIQETSLYIGLDALLTIILLVLYAVNFAKDSKKLTQKSDSGVSGTTMNVYGAGKVIENENFIAGIWDGTDVAVPEEANSVIFITTKRVKILQHQGKCSESPNIAEARCSKDENCDSSKVYRKGNGISTGKCDNGTCEVTGWCPINYIENKDTLTVEKLNSSDYFLHIKNRVFFSVDGVNRTYSNFLAEEENYSNKEADYEEHKSAPCLYDPADKKAKHCPYFSVLDTVKAASEQAEFPDSITTKNVAIAIALKYECDFNNEIECKPEYSIDLLDNSEKYPRLAVNHTYTYATYDQNDRSSRVLTKVTGIIFLIQVDARIWYWSPDEILPATGGLFIGMLSIKPMLRRLSKFGNYITKKCKRNSAM